MKLWHKVFLCVLILFLIAFDFGTYLITKKSYEINRDANTQSGIYEHQALAQALDVMIKYFQNDINKDDISLLDTFAQKYEKKGIFMEIYKDNKRMYSNFLEFDDERIELQKKEVKGVYRKINNILYLFTTGTLDNSGLSLVVIRNSNFLSDFSDEILHYFITINIATSIILCIVLIIILKQLTKPLDKLNSITNEIANGNYDMRVNIKRKDEIGEFAENFNKMSEAISKHIEILEQSNQEKERFVNNLTHEFRTPLATIKGYSELLLKANCTEKDKNMATKYIYEHTTRLEKLIQKLIQILYLKRQTMSFKRISVQKLFDDVLLFEKNSLLQKNICIETNIQLKEILCDEVLIQTVLINLMENAIRVCNDEGKIILKSYKYNEYHVLEIKDFGIGIPKNEIDKITEEFYRVDKSRARHSGGIGLGLSICKQIMELHGGIIKIESVKNEFTSVKLKFTTNLQLNA